MFTKLQRDIASVVSFVRSLGRSAKLAFNSLYWNIRSKAPACPEPVRKLILDRRLAPFFFGMACEAAGLTIQIVLGIPIFPILDAIVAIVIVAVIVWYQKKEGVI